MQLQLCITEIIRRSIFRRTLSAPTSDMWSRTITFIWEFIIVEGSRPRKMQTLDQASYDRVSMLLSPSFWMLTAPVTAQYSRILSRLLVQLVIDQSSCACHTPY